MRTKRRFPHYIFIPVIFFALLVSCEDEPNIIGSGLLPSGDDFLVSFDSLELVHGYTKYADSIRASYKENHLLGSINDPFFGSSRAEILTTISSSITSKGFGDGAEHDSVILYLTWNERIGEGRLPLTVHLYEFNEFLRFDSTYFSNMDMEGKYREPELGSTTISVGDTSVMIFISDTSFIGRFLNAEDSILRNSDYLQEMMYGLYLTTDDATDEGSIVRINFDKPGNFLFFFYRNDTADSQTQYFLLENGSNGRVNMFRHDPSDSLNAYLQNGSDNDSLIFVQSMAGVSSVIRFPELSRWLDSMPIAINEARLTFTMADTNLTMQHERYFPESLDLYLVNEDGSITRAYDNLLDPDNFGGEYDNQTMSYSFSIKVQLQSMLEEQKDELEMMLVPSSTGETVRRAGLYGNCNRDLGRRIRLDIIYTLL